MEMNENNTNDIIENDEANTNEDNNNEKPYTFGTIGSFLNGGFPDYKQLFDKYSDIFNQQDKNCEFLKNCIDILNLQLGKAKRTSWFAIILAVAAIIVAIVK